MILFLSMRFIVNSGFYQPTVLFLRTGYMEECMSLPYLKNNWTTVSEKVTYFLSRYVCIYRSNHALLTFFYNLHQLCQPMTVAKRIINHLLVPTSTIQILPPAIEEAIRQGRTSRQVSCKWSYSCASYCL